ncbi:MAG: hypothetical protein K2L99_05815 [Muribaculaceae bacterium]|nr:hypothetical protein [Muribaculaceae bacterium]MDE6286490.1 hypothetical protein [Muribaculaceae bacterium]
MNRKRTFTAGALLGAAVVAFFTTAPGWVARTKIKEALRRRGLYPPAGN